VTETRPARSHVEVQVEHTAMLKLFVARLQKPPQGLRQDFNARPVTFQLDFHPGCCVLECGGASGAVHASQLLEAAVGSVCRHTGMCRHKPAQAGFDCAGTPRAGRLCAGAATGTASSFVFHPERGVLVVLRHRGSLRVALMFFLCILNILR
jgi:hypothetical protein